MFQELIVLETNTSPQQTLHVVGIGSQNPVLTQPLTLHHKDSEALGYEHWA